MSGLVSICMVLAVAWMFISSAKELNDSTNDNDEKDNVKEQSATRKAEYHKISANEAKQLLDKNSEVLLIDVRTADEYKEKRIKGAILIPDFEITDKAESKLPDKEAIILVYCRSGKRSESASRKLVALGYTNIYDFGGINTYPHETISG